MIDAEVPRTMTVRRQVICKLLVHLKMSKIDLIY